LSRAWRTALALSAALAVLQGCASRGPLIEPGARTVELTHTPFFPQDKYQCGPAALATVLGASGVPISPDELVPLVYLPARRGSLTIEMQAAPRRFGRMAYALEPELESIIAQLDAGYPVLVLHNYGLPFWPRWHYAVVIGYDAAQQRLLLRSGKRERQQLTAANFMRAWDNADRWALVLLRPGELPASPSAAAYLEAATAFERSASPADARRTYEVAIERWPEDPIAWVGRGTAHYRTGAFREAAADYARALALDPSLAAARNNRSMALLDMGCPAAARRELSQIDATGQRDALREAIADTARQIQARSGAPEAVHCPAP
jgi:tetratricopeptide (TPR) repeat protein